MICARSSTLFICLSSKIFKIRPDRRATTVISRLMSSCEIEKKFALPKRYGSGKKSIWMEFNELAEEHQPINLGQGFPDFAPPKHVTRALEKVALSDNVLFHQYSRGYGHPRLVKILSKLYSELVDHDIDPLSEMLVASGAYEALFAAIDGHGDEGDEIIIIEPYFDCYEPMVRFSGAKPRFIPLRHKGRKSGETLCSANFQLDKCELEGLFNEKTKAIIMNNPNNPFGTVYSMEQLTMIADLCKKHNVICISDEVYEWLVYPPNKHIKMATLPDMWDRTITIGSAGKTFSVTGWKIGWAYGPKHLIHNLQIAHQNCVNICPTPTQEALAMAFEKEVELKDSDPDECYFFTNAKRLEKKRDFMVKTLTEVNMRPIIPQAGYFILADITSLVGKIDLSCEKDKYKDQKIAKWMAKNIGLLGIPPTTFYSKEHKNLIENYIRYCFIKDDEKLEKTAELLKLFISG